MYVANMFTHLKLR